MLCEGYRQSQIRVQLLQTQAGNVEAKQGEAACKFSSSSHSLAVPGTEAVPESVKA